MNCSIVERPSDTEAQVVDPENGRGFGAKCRTDVLRKAQPGTAANDVGIGIAPFEPRRTVRRRAFVIVVPDVFAPFQDVAMDLKKAPGIRRKITNGYGLLAIFTLGAAVSIKVIAVVVGLLRTDGEPHQNGVAVPARATYSHSASVSNR